MASRKSIVVVGGAGYLGGAVVRELVESGYRVTTIDDLSLGSAERTHRADQFIRLDVRDRSALTAILSHQKPAVVVHLGGRYSHRTSMERPEVTFEANLGGTSALLGALHATKCRNLVLGSDIAVYGDGGEVFSESDPCAPRTAQAWSLLAAEKLVQFCAGAWGLETTILRFSLLGGGDLGSERSILDLPDNPIAHLVFAARRDRQRKPLELDQPDRAVDLVHVDEAANAVGRTVELLVHGEPAPPLVNISRGRTEKLSELVLQVEELTGRSLHVVHRSIPEGLPLSLTANNELAASTLGWTPKRSVKEILSDGVL